MKHKLLYLILSIVFTSTTYGQAIAHNAPNMTQCSYELFNLTLQTPTILGSQNPTQYTVQYFTTLASAQSNTFAIADPANYIYYQQTLLPIYARVTNNSSGDYATTSFNIICYFASMPAPYFPDVNVCQSYTLPPYYAGNYKTSPDDSGTFLPAGTVLTTSQTVYVLSNCFETVSFTVTISSIPNLITLPPQIFACESYTLPNIGSGIYYYGNQVVPAGTIITESTNLSVYAESPNNPLCNYNEVLEIYIGFPTNASIISCDQDGISQFNLNDAIPQETVVSPNAQITYHLTQASAQAGTNALPLLYTNTTPFLQTIYIRYALPSCVNIYPLELKTNFTEYNAIESIPACDNNDGTYTITGFIIPTYQLTNGNYTTTNVEYFATQQEAEANENYISLPFTSSLPAIYIRVSDAAAECYAVLTVPVEPGECPTNILQGYTLFDQTGDGCNNGNDFIASHLHFSYTPAIGDILHTYANFDYYFENLPDGTGTVAVENLPEPFVASAAQQITFPSENEYELANFCITATASLLDVGVYMVPTTILKPGFETSYYLYIENNGTQIENLSATITFDDQKLTFLGASYGSAFGNTFTYAATDLNPFEKRMIQLTFGVQQPPIANSGDVVLFSASVDAINDANPADNVYVMEQTVQNSYDPNTITVLQGEYITEEQADDYLYYTINFQNLGTAYATNVRIEEVLNDNLDWETFEPVSSNAAYHTKRINNSVVFNFDYIFLQQSPEFEEASKRYVTYRIKPKATVAIGDVMTGQASIFFDYNPAVPTNTATTTIQATAGSKDVITSSFMIYPNPASGRVTLQLQNAVDSASVTITDVLGKTVQTATISGTQASLDVLALKAGVYFVSLNADGKHTTKKLVIK